MFTYCIISIVSLPTESMHPIAKYIHISTVSDCARGWKKICQPLLTFIWLNKWWRNCRNVWCCAPENISHFHPHDFGTQFSPLSPLFGLHYLWNLLGLDISSFFWGCLWRLCFGLGPLLFFLLVPLAESKSAKSLSKNTFSWAHRRAKLQEGNGP